MRDSEEGDPTVEEAARHIAGSIARPESPYLPGSAKDNEIVGLCLSSFGVAVTYAGAGGVLRQSTSEQSDRDERLVDACMVAAQQLGYVSYDTSDPELLARLYDANLKVRDCLLSLGIELEEPVSLDAYMDGETWDPLSGVPSYVDSDTGTLYGPGIECGVEE